MGLCVCIHGGEGQAVQAVSSHCFAHKVQELTVGKRIKEVVGYKLVSQPD